MKALQVLLHASVPASQPRLMQLSPARSVPSHTSPGSTWLLPQELQPVVMNPLHVPLQASEPPGKPWDAHV
jgi:hypothetical protein